MDDLVQQLESLGTTDRIRILELLNPSAGDATNTSSSTSTAHHSTERIVVTQQSLFNRKLRLFSGKHPVPSGEVDFETWRLQVCQISDDQDDALTGVHLRRVIIQSLQRPALDTVKSCTSSSQILQILDNLYGSVEDGQELLIQYYTTYQMDKEQASSYLQRLYLLIMDVAEKGGVHIREVPQFLIRQFVRGSHDEVMINKMGFENQLEEPPNFAEALLAVRKEEARRTEKRLRLKSVGRVAVVSTVASNTVSANPEDKQLIRELQNRLALLENQVQLQQHRSFPKCPGLPQSREKDSDEQSQCSGSTSSIPSRDSNHSKWKTRPPKRNKQCFCYSCGDDGHYANNCQKKPNAELVQFKLLQRYSGND